MVKRVVSLLAAVFMVCASSFSVSAWSADSFVADSSNYYKLFPSTFSVQAVSDSSDSSSFLDINSLFDLGHWDCDGFAFWVTCHNDGYDSLPGYRLNSGSSWDYYDLHLIPTDSNMRIATSMSDYIPVSVFLPYLLILFGGVVILCFMKRS